ncbi:hypothetical protein ES288_D02G030900v1 [Gossypium darwinii]|uniref:Uncharacterized protein n=1 Tax=Gossypium darwinii TaxID=34276 RepID=A0A5D2D8P6_GOSDA|nr:hypothetical protein ES288_D02G030900v1 [Gossypium darwinii]
MMPSLLPTGLQSRTQSDSDSDGANQIPMASALKIQKILSAALFSSSLQVRRLAGVRRWWTWHSTLGEGPGGCGAGRRAVAARVF